MKCTYYYQLIESPEKYVFGVLFILLAMLAAVGNTTGILVLKQPELKTITNRIVTSLCVIGCFVGYGFLPIIAWNMFDVKSSALCYLIIPRVAITAIMYITTNLNMCILTYDRYILLTKGASYNEHMSHFKVSILITISWVAPVVFISVLYAVNESYRTILIAALNAIPLVITFGLYVLLRVTVHRKERELKEHTSNIQINGLQTRKTILDTAARQRHVKLAKTLNILMISGLCLLLPLCAGHVAYFLESIKVVEKTRARQIYFVGAMLLTNSIAFIHLVLYYTKYPEFKRSLWKLLRIKKVYSEGNNSQGGV